MQTLGGEAIESPAQTPPAPEPHTQPQIQGFFAKWAGKWWAKLLWRATKVLFAVGSLMVTLLWTLALWDSYRPKITVSPGPTLDPKSPVGTYFIVQNQGALSIANIRYLTRLAPLPIPGASNAPNVVSQEQNVSVIPEMRSLESYSLSFRHAGVQINTLPVSTATNQIQTTNGVQFPIAGLLLTFEISYDPKFYWKRTETFHFVGLEDVAGDWQWLPTAHQNITEQIIDTNLLPRAPVASAPVGPPTNGDVQVHTNQDISPK
jgi:hypothetical protein